MIEIQNVSKTYREGSKALQNINITIDDGEFVFIMGKSGAGKSTLLKLLIKELEPTGGQIIVDEMNLQQMPKRFIPRYRRQLGMVFQDFRLLRDRNVFENVAFALRVVGASPRLIRESVPRALKMVGLSAKYKSLPQHLSGGEQQRVAIARALINRPKVLLADEPTGNLDHENALEIMKLLEKINNQGTTVVVITHSRELVEMMGKRVITLEHGRVVSDERKGGAAEDEN
jgi:cell division transport system ATP-binding protein